MHPREPCPERAMRPSGRGWSASRGVLGLPCAPPAPASPGPGSHPRWGGRGVPPAGGERSTAALGSAPSHQQIKVFPLCPAQCLGSNHSTDFGWETVRYVTVTRVWWCSKIISLVYVWYCCGFMVNPVLPGSERYVVGFFPLGEMQVVQRQGCESSVTCDFFFFFLIFYFFLAGNWICCRHHQR